MALCPEIEDCLFDFFFVVGHYNFSSNFQSIGRQFFFQGWLESIFDPPLVNLSPGYHGADFLDFRRNHIERGFTRSQNPFYSIHASLVHVQRNQFGCAHQSAFFDACVVWASSKGEIFDEIDFLDDISLDFQEPRSLCQQVYFPLAGL